MKKVLLPLVGAGIFLLDESLKNYAEENLQPGTEKKLTGRIVLRRVHCEAAAAQASLPALNGKQV